MQYATALLSLTGLAAASPFKFPLSNGFPNPPASQIPVIEKNAGGTLPNGALPKSLGPNGHLDFQVIAANEIFEVAYFTSLLKNVTDGVPGYECTGMNKTEIEADLFEIRAQEELHALGANAILKNAGYPVVQPCEYTFPVSNFKDALALAETFTSIVLGTLQQVQGQLAAESTEEQALIPLIGSIIGQEGEQTGYYRFFQHKVPSAAPFLTTSAGQFAFNALVQNFIVPGSCPNPPDVPAFKLLKVVAQPPAANSTVSFTSPYAASAKSDYIAYISGQNSPTVVPISSVTAQGSTYTITAPFPFDAGFSKGLTLAALTSSAGPFSSAADVAAATIAGPGLIEVQ